MNNNKKAIDYFSYGHPLIKLKSMISYNARIKIYNIFTDIFDFDEYTKVIDIGVTPDITLKESNFFEELYPYKKNITATSIEDASFLENKYTGLKFFQTNPEEKLPFKDNEFDLLFCSAVIEHVGSKSKQKEFIKECMRISKNCFFTTPNRFFPIEMHTFIPFLHWLPVKLFRKILILLKKDFWAKEDNLNLLTKKSFLKLINKNKKIYIITLKTFFWPSNIIAYTLKK